jgi:alpha-2-macroglobulin-like protein
MTTIFSLLFYSIFAFQAPVSPLAHAAPTDKKAHFLRDSLQPSHLEAQLARFHQIEALKKVYLRTDRSLYAPGESLWMSVNVCDAALLTPVAISNGVRVELINPRGAVVTNQYMDVSKGVAAGHFELGSNWPGGIYKLRAYPSVLGSNANFLYEREVTLQSIVLPNLDLRMEFERKSYGPGDVAIARLDVKNAANEPLANFPLRFVAALSGVDFAQGDAQTDANGRAYIRVPLPADISKADGLLNVMLDYQGETESISRSIPLTLDDIKIQFFAEGGDAVEGLPTRMAFKATNGFGKPADVSGSVFDAAGQKVADFESYHNGMGAFDLLPRRGQAYTARLHKPFHSEKSHPLPAAKPAGATLRLQERGTGELVFEATSASPQEMTLVGVCRSEMFFSQEIARGQSGPIRVPVSELPMGVAYFTLFDAQGQPVAERLTFVGRDKGLQVEAKSNKKTYLPREKVEISLRVRDHRGKPLRGTFSMAVVDAAQRAFADDKQGNIMASLLLEQDVKGKVEEPNFYFDEREPKSEQALEYLLMTQGWRRFDWKTIQNTKYEPPVASSDENPATVRWKNRAKTDAYTLNIQVRDAVENLIGVSIKSFRKGAFVRGAATNVDGLARLSLEPGMYDLDISYTGYQTVHLKDVKVTKDNTKEAFVTMLPPVLLEEVTVTAYMVPLMEREASMSMAVAEDRVKPIEKKKASSTNKPAAKVEIGQTLSADQIKNLPTRSINAIVATTSGATSLDGDDISIKGSRSSAREYYIDGVRVAGQDMKMEKKKAPAVQRQFYVPDAAAQEQIPRGEDRRKTMFWQASVQTDENGTAKEAFQASDDLGNFEICLEGLAGGQPAHVLSYFQVEKPISVAVKTPDFVLVGDTLRLQFVASNSSPADVQGQLAVEVPKHFEAVGMLLANISVTARSTQVVTVTFVVKTPETEAYQDIKCVFRAAEAFEEAYVSRIKTRMRGFPIREVFSGHEAQNTFQVRWENPIENTEKVTLTAYPSTLNEVLSGMDRMLRQPNGCFEQVSSSNYPNLLVLDLLRSTGKVNPEVEGRALQYLEQGYKKLTGYESKSGGFDWYGRDPGHEGLTAYGILQFTDMAKVFPVDQDMIARNLRWLLSRRDGKGGWLRNPNCLHSWNKDATLDAYLAWAFAVSGHGADIRPEIEYAYQRSVESQDPYLLALMANALYALNDPRAASLTATLAKTQLEDGKWTEKGTSVTGSGGQCLHVETAAMAALALLQDARYTAQQRKCLEFIQKSKNEYGYGSTQSTVLALKALVAYATKEKAATGDGKLVISVDGKPVEERSYSSQQLGTLVVEGLEKHLAGGNKRVEVWFEGRHIPFDVDVQYASRLPRNVANCPFDFKTAFERGKVATGETVRLGCSLQNTMDKPLASPMIVLGIPAGLTLQPWQLKELQEKKAFDFYELWDGFAVFHFESLAPGALRDIRLDLRADIPGVFEAPASQAFLYYENDKRTWVKPETVVVQ